MAKGNKEEDLRGTKSARAEMAKRGIDLSQADLRVTAGVLHIRGIVRAYRDSPIPNIKTEMELVARVLRQKPEIRDVVLECTFRE